MPNLQAPASTEKKIWPASKGRTVEGTSVSFRCVAYAHAQFTHTPACWPFFLRGGSLVAREKARGGRQAREAPERVVGKGLGADIRGRRAADPPTFRHKCGTSQNVSQRTPRRRSAGVPPAFRRRSAPVPHPFRTPHPFRIRSAPVPHATRTGAAPVPHRCRTGAAAVPQRTRTGTCNLQTARKAIFWGVFTSVFFGVFVLLGVF